MADIDLNFNIYKSIHYPQDCTKKEIKQHIKKLKEQANLSSNKINQLNRSEAEKQPKKDYQLFSFSRNNQATVFNNLIKEGLKAIDKKYSLIKNPIVIGAIITAIAIIVAPLLALCFQKPGNSKQTNINNKPNNLNINGSNNTFSISQKSIINQSEPTTKNQ